MEDLIWAMIKTYLGFFLCIAVLFMYINNIRGSRLAMRLKKLAVKYDGTVEYGNFFSSYVPRFRFSAHDCDILVSFKPKGRFNPPATSMTCQLALPTVRNVTIYKKEFSAR